MSPHKLYDALCVLHAAANILSRAAAIQVEQASSTFVRQPPHWEPSITRGPIKKAQSVETGDTPQAPTVETATKEPTQDLHTAPSPDTRDEPIQRIIPTNDKHEGPPRMPLSSSSPSVSANVKPKLPPIFRPMPRTPPHPSASIPQPPKSTPLHPEPTLARETSYRLPSESIPHATATPFSKPKPASPSEAIHKAYQARSQYLPPLEDFPDDGQQAPMVLKASKVPSSRIGRLFHYGSLAAGLTTGAASEFLRRSTNRTSDPSTNSVFMSEANISRLVDKLSQMRGAALKMGQFMSIQDAHVLPEHIEKVLRKVQNMAHYMPNWQMEKVMSTELGPDWKSHFETFEQIPMASASIGQVHKATLSPSSPYYPKDLLSSTSPEPLPLAIKIQFPNVQNSIISDLKTISLLLSTTTPLLPKGLFMDSTLKAMQKELADECDYIREAGCGVRFAEYLKGDERFRVPRMIGFRPDVLGSVGEWKSLTTPNVLVMERMEGVPLGATVKWEQEVRNEIARNVLVLCLRELFDFRLMQTDPNWSNFLYNRRTRQIELIDFGASREYSKEFMDKWYLLLKAAIEGDREAGLKYSTDLGYLLGGESEAMVDAHLQSLALLGQPFSKSTPQPFSFASNEIPTAIRGLIPTMLESRLTPPPKETYSLNRKLGGAFLLCGRLRAEVDCVDVWEEVVGEYRVQGSTDATSTMHGL